MVRADRLLSAAIAALLLSSPAMLRAQDPTVGASRPSAPQAVSLSDAISMAEKVSPTVFQAENTIRSAGLGVRTAKWAFVPQLTIQPQASLALASGNARLDPVTQELISGNQTNPSYGFRIDGSLVVFDGFKRSADLKRAHAQENAAEVGLVTSKYASALTVTNAFLAVLSDQKLIEVNTSAVKSAEQQYNVAVAKLRAGSANYSDSLSAFVNLNSAKLTLLQSQNTLATDEATLARYIGVPGRVGAIDDSSFYRTPTAIDTTSLRASAREVAPALRSAAANIESARASYRSAKTGYFPTLTVGASSNWNASKQNDYALRAIRNLNIALNFSPWTNFARETQIETALIQVENQEAALTDQIRQVDANLTAQFAAITNAQAQIDLSQFSMAAAETNLRVVTSRYQLGVATITELLTAQQSLTQSQVNAVTARYAYLRAKVQIENILGRSL